MQVCVTMQIFFSLLKLPLQNRDVTPYTLSCNHERYRQIQSFYWLNNKTMWDKLHSVAASLRFVVHLN